MVLLLAIFLSLALFLNKDQIAIEIIKIIDLLFAGGLGGYAIGRQQPKSKDADDK